MKSSFFAMLLTGLILPGALLFTGSPSSPIQFLAQEGGRLNPEIPSPPVGSGLQRLYRSLRQREPVPVIPIQSDQTSYEEEPEEIEKEPEIEIESPVFERREKKLPNTEIGLLTPDELKRSSIPVEQKSEKQDPVPPKKKDPSQLDPISFPSSLEPTPKNPKAYSAPSFYRGLYLNNFTARTPERYEELLSTASELEMNVLVVDVQPRMPPESFVQKAKELGFHLVSRVVVFEGGLKQYPPDLDHIAKVLKTAETSARTGFHEVQLDYIRFADRTGGMGLSLEKRYRLIEGILRMATDRLRPLGVLVGADIFGRIAFNKNDVIGQKLEVFAPHLDTIYPMLYPSHFYGEPDRIKDPYGTVLDGASSAVKRIGSRSRVVSYIQGFKMKITPSGLGYEGYIRRQLQAVDAAGDGYVVWNAGNRYSAFFSALREHKKTDKKNKD